MKMKHKKEENLNLTINVNKALTGFRTCIKLPL
jgi:hypothetical protein